MPEKVIIEVRKGCAMVAAKPKGLVVEIRDYDIQDEDCILKDAAGELYHKVEC